PFGDRSRSSHFPFAAAVISRLLGRILEILGILRILRAVFCGSRSLSSDGWIGLWWPQTSGGELVQSPVGVIHLFIQCLNFVQDCIHFGIDGSLAVSYVVTRALQLFYSVLDRCVVGLQVLLKVPELSLQFQNISLELIDIFLRSGDSQRNQRE